MKKVRLTKESLMKAIEEEAAATAVPGVGEQIATPKAFKKTQDLSEGIMRNVKTRTVDEQYRFAFKEAKKKLREVNSLLEYCKNMRKEGNSYPPSRIRTEVKKLKYEMFGTKVSLSELSGLDETLSPQDYEKAKKLLDRLKTSDEKLFYALLQLVTDENPHSMEDVDTIVNSSSLNENKQAYLDLLVRLEEIINSVDHLAANVATNRELHGVTKQGLLTALDDIENELQNLGADIEKSEGDTGAGFQGNEPGDGDSGFRG